MKNLDRFATNPIHFIMYCPHLYTYEDYNTQNCNSTCSYSWVRSLDSEGETQTESVWEPINEKNILT
jgi:hypothetical protein